MRAPPHGLERRPILDMLARLADTRGRDSGGRGDEVRGEPRRARRGAHERRGGVREVREGEAPSAGERRWRSWRQEGDAAPGRPESIARHPLPPAPEPAIRRSFSQEKHPRRRPRAMAPTSPGRRTRTAFGRRRRRLQDRRVRAPQPRDDSGVVTRLDRDGPTRCARGFVHGLSNAGLNTAVAEGASAMPPPPPPPMERVAGRRRLRRCRRRRGNAAAAGAAAWRSPPPPAAHRPACCRAPGGGVDYVGHGDDGTRGRTGARAARASPPPPLDQSERAAL